MQTETRIYLLGAFRVEVAGTPVPSTAWRKRRPVELLSALALAPGRVLHREELIDRLWPDKDLEAGANNLHRALYDLRRIVGGELALMDRGAARLADETWIDVDAFERAAAGTTQESLRDAVALYRGILLPDDPYPDAIATRREALRQRFVDTGLKLAAQQHALGEHDPCIEVLRRVIAQDPTVEPAVQLLMRALAETGRTADALRQFGDCVSALRARLDAAPSKATLALKVAIECGEIVPRAPASVTLDASAQLVPADAPPSGSSAGSDASIVLERLISASTTPTLWGRSQELAAVREVVPGGQGVLLISGEAGVGKTRLAAECVRLAALEGATVMLGVCLEHDAGVPYAPFADAWAHLRRNDGVGLPDDPFASFSPAGGSAQEDRLRLFQAVEHAVEQLAARAPVCLLFEDLHHADPSSLALFHHLARATRTLSLLLIGMIRDDEVRVGRAVHALLGNVGRERLGTRINLTRFDRAASDHLVRDLLAGSGLEVSDVLLASVYDLAEGNPFHTEEVVLAMRDEGATAATAPKNLLATVRHRISRLGRDAERLLLAAAVFGLRFPFDAAQAASGLSAEAALDALELGLDARILEEDEEEYRFRHALTRQALLDTLTHARRVHLHRALASALEQGALRSDMAEILAHHHQGAGQLDRALPYLLTAAERAQRRLGFHESVSFFERALELMDAVGSEDGAVRFRVLRNLGGMRMALSDLDGAIRDLDAAAELDTPEYRPSASERAIARRIAALALIQAGRLDEAGTRLVDAEEVLRGDQDSPELSAVLYLLAQLRWHQERFAEARDLARRSLSLAEARGDQAAMAKGHEMLALAFHSLGAWQEGYAHEQQRQALAAGTLDVDQAFDVHLCLWEYHQYGDQGIVDIRDSVERMLEQARRMKAPRAVALCENFAGTVDFVAGRWADAEAQLRQAIEGFRRVGAASGEALSLQRLAILLTARGQLDEARQLLADGIVVAERAAMRSHCLTRMHASIARNRLAAGDEDAAADALREGLAEAARHGHCSTCDSLLLPEAVRVDIARGDLRSAQGHADALEKVATQFGSRAWGAMAQHARGRVLAAQGRPDQALAELQNAQGKFEALGSPYDAARCALAASRLRPKAENEAWAGKLAALGDRARQTLASIGASELEV